MILVAFRHGLRASELCDLQWSDVEFESGTLYLRRAKGGATGTHPLLGDELRALRALKRDAKSPFVFVGARGAVLHLRLGQTHRACRCRGQDAVSGACAHVAPCLRIRAGQQGYRYPDPSGLSRPSIDPEHGQIHRTGARPVQEPVEMSALPTPEYPGQRRPPWDSRLFIRSADCIRPVMDCFW